MVRKKREYIFYSGGALGGDYKYYVEREADAEAIKIVRRGKYLYIVAPRQTGKTSLIKRLNIKMKRLGCKCCYINLAAMKNLSHTEWFMTLGNAFATQIDCNLSKPFKNHDHFVNLLLSQLNKSVNIGLFLDEVEGIKDYSFSDGFLMAIRGLYDQKDSYPGSLFVAFSGAFEPKNIIKDPTISPFNVADSINLTDFSIEESYGLTCHLSELGIAVTKEVFNHIYHWAKGHPYLTQRICTILEDRVRARELKVIDTCHVDETIDKKILDPDYMDSNIIHLQREIERLEEPALSLWKELRRGNPISYQAPGGFHIYLTGAIRRKDKGMEVRNRIYEILFDELYVYDSNEATIDSPKVDTVRILRIVVASPGDVQAECDLIPGIIEELNRGTARDRGLRLELSRWESDAYPVFHSNGPQGLIDPVLAIEDCDMLIGIFWKRFGTPTRGVGSGTEHEILMAYESWKEKGKPGIMIYFKEKEYHPETEEEKEQWAKVTQFKEKFPGQGLSWKYKDEVEFERLLRNHLINCIGRGFCD